MTSYTMTRKAWAHAANCVDVIFGASHLAYAFDRQCWPFGWDDPVTIPLDRVAEEYLLTALSQDAIDDMEEPA